MPAYRDWLIARLEAFRHPVDLVGHDWGGGHVLNVAMARRPATSARPRRDQAW
jgi:pimeloyl-ACP methyl ester carboxylesterase